MANIYAVTDKNEKFVNKHHQIHKRGNNCFVLKQNTTVDQTKINKHECCEVAETWSTLFRPETFVANFVLLTVFI